MIPTRSKLIEYCHGDRPFRFFIGSQLYIYNIYRLYEVYLTRIVYNMIGRSVGAHATCCLSLVAGTGTW
jgi:hypothetical protein